MSFNYSIILSTYNWPSALKCILDRLLVQLNEHPDVELIIADDGSAQDTQLLINDYQRLLPQRIKHIWIEDHGFRKSTALNKAVLAAQGSYLIFLDGDCIPFPDYVSWHKKLAQAGYFVAGNRILLSEEYTQQVLSDPRLLEGIFTWELLSWFSAKISKKVNKIFSFLRFNPNIWWRYLRQTDWKYPKGCNVAMHRSSFLAVNGYDELFSGWGHEDADLFIRLLHNNLKIKDGRFAIPVLHLWHKESSRINESTNYNRLIERLNDKGFILAKHGLNKA